MEPDPSDPEMARIQAEMREEAERVADYEANLYRWEREGRQGPPPVMPPEYRELQAWRDAHPDEAAQIDADHNAAAWREFEYQFNRWERGGRRGPIPEMPSHGRAVEEWAQAHPEEVARIRADADRDARRTYDDIMSRTMADYSRYGGGPGLLRRVRDGFRRWRYRQP